MGGISDFPLLRITLFGSGSSGKTALANAFVNNYCTPNSTHPTEWPQLYYKVCRIPEEEDPSVQSPLRSVCVEIEDTYDSTRVDDGRDIRRFMTMKRKISKKKKNVVSVGKGMTDFTPFNLWKPPAMPVNSKEPYVPITHGRMGMLIVFDVNRKQTFNKAMEIYDTIESVLDFKQETLKPIIFLVGTQYDVDPTSEKVQSLLGEAETYAQAKFLRFWKVSAIDGKNVKKMFREMIYRILGMVMLWDFVYEEDSTSEEENEGCSIM
ncbi:ras family protein [Cystoisospora suis]|uniref:Ras family protein n=1 Tax=Cystoisospora suis TaxID=483139 RepID=A0A2C6KTD0_9APIC|nr:ras family protein [Cystoisospora suis]